MSDFDYDRADVKIFNISLSPEDYSEWVIHNSYSKKVPLGYQLVGKKETQYGKNYVLSADYKDPSQCSNNIKTAFFARAQLNHDNWPLFQHFKFMDLKDSDEYQLVEYIRCYSSDRAVEALKRKYAKFIIKEGKGETRTTLLFEFINNDIGKKLQIYATGNTYCESYLLLEIKNV
ncbi:hypothetical protein DdX_18487 [Ditylenchus destructor]|uniref:Uncharacterized protein n=1 Tax=Ditylenchus destructor TaxID=166010 RepID=A0AAD4QSU1_9BILA|nr:hypothetical protein DdX_18487 [Ditylenchus destructor]